MTDRDELTTRERWARFRFSVIGPLLAAPPDKGELRARLEELASRIWRHPTNGRTIRYGVSTFERWFYTAKSAPDPVAALERKVRKTAGIHPRISAPLGRAIELQYQAHPRWSYQLHHDNLVVLAEQDPTLGTVPSYTTVVRYMKERGLLKRRRRRRSDDRDEALFVPREMRSFEVEHVDALWHSDFHVGRRKVLLPSGELVVPVLFGMLDDRSRLCCHAQWYAEPENTASFVHGTSQAFLKRRLPRQILTDNGAAMTSAEATEGLLRLGIVHWTTLPATPEQNAKQESFWATVEGRLMAMLEGVKPLTLELLNQATQAWIELDYHRTPHSETKQTPLERWLAGPSVGRPSPSADALRQAFRMQATRTQRRSDGTISVEGRRFEIPSRYRTLLQPTIRYARWDLSSVDLIDPRSGRVLSALLPLDKQKNADRRRRPLEPVGAHEPERPSDMAPLLKKLMSEYAATGLPPAYLPESIETDKSEENEP